MKSFTFAIVAAAALAASSAQAATPVKATASDGTITFAPVQADGSFTGMFGHEGIAEGAFRDVFRIAFPQAGVAGATISSIFTTNKMNDVNFRNVSLGGQDFEIGSTGRVEFRFLDGIDVDSEGFTRLIVSGRSGGNGTYSGTLAFTPSVPEPATWAMMLLGFGMTGVAIRRRSATRTTVAYA